MFLGLAPVDVNLSASPSGCVSTCAVLFLSFLVLLFLTGVKCCVSGITDTLESVTR